MNKKTEVQATSNLNVGTVAAVAASSGGALTANERETAYTVSLDTPTACRIQEDYDSIWLKFTANDNSAHLGNTYGVYRIYTEGIHTYGAVYPEDSDFHIEPNEVNSSQTFDVFVTLNYGESYYIQLLSYNSPPGLFNICVEGVAREGTLDDDRATALPLPLNQWKNSYINSEFDEKWFRFVANAPDHKEGEVGYYTIRSKGALNTYGELFAADSNIRLNANDDGADIRNFFIRHPLNYGETYYVKVVSVGEAVGNFSVRVEFDQEATLRNKASENTEADPVDLCTGAHFINVDLMNLFGGQNLRLTAHYNSTQLGEGDLGIGWHHDYEKHLVFFGSLIFLYERPSVYSIFAPTEEDGQWICISPGREGFVLTPQSNGTYSLDCNGERIETYGSDGHLRFIRNKYGFETEIAQEEEQIILSDLTTWKTIYLQKNEEGKITRVYDDDGRSATLTYENGMLTKICDVNGNSLTYTYDGAGRVLTGCDDNGVCYFTNTYSPDGRIATQQDALGNTTRFGHIDSDRQVWDRCGFYTDRTYNEQGLMVMYGTPDGDKYYTYDARGNITSETDLEGNTKTALYNSFNKPTQITDYNGNTTYYEYDTRGNCTKITYPDCTFETFTYNEYNMMTSHTDLRGTTTVITGDRYPETIQVGEREPIELHYDFDRGLLLYEIDAKGNRTDYGYNALGQRISKTDAQGRTTTYEYDLSGHLLKATDPLGNSVSYEYDCNYQRIAEVDANGNRTAFTYNGNLKPVKVTYPNGTTVLQEYDAMDRPTVSTDPAGKKTIHTYDGMGRVLSTAFPDGGIQGFSYDFNGRLTTETNPEEGEIQRTYDANGNVLSVSGGKEGYVQYQYDCRNRCIRSVNAVSGATLYEYSPAGDLLSVTDPLGNKTTFTYDAYGNRLSVTDPLNHTTAFTYDANNNLVSMTDALGNGTTYVYDALNQLVEVTDPKNQTTAFAYDALGRRISVTDALGNTVYTAYDAKGNVLSVTDASCNVISATAYNEMNQPVSTTDALGRVTSYEYNALGKVQKITDPLGLEKQFEYDAMGRNNKVIDSMNGISTATFDKLGNVTALVGPLGGGTSYTYDNRGRLLTESTPSGKQVTYTYNALNLKSKRTNARGQEASFTYDAAGRMTGFSTGGDSVSYTYDACGNILTVTDSHGTVTRTYDAMHRVTSYTDTFGKTVRYAYDAVGNLIRLTYPDNTAVTYTYDANNNLLTVTDWAGRVTRYVYDEHNQVVQVTKPDGSVTANVYDIAHRLLSSAERNSEGAVIAGFEYEYDALGRVVTEKSLAKNTQMMYTYDELSRVTGRYACCCAEGCDCEDEDYFYDAAGNITLANYADTASYDLQNRLILFNGQSVSYDNDGNMLSGNGLSCSYDSANRLISAGDCAYTYNGEDARIRMESCGSVTTYTYDCVPRLSRLLIKTTDGVETKYVYGLGLIGEESCDTFKTYHFDARGSTVAITDSAGAITEEFSYDTYGKLLCNSASGCESETAFLYNGMYGVMTDPNGLCYMRARYYSPELRRFINTDPVHGKISHAITLNRYAYANGNPVSFVDPFGLEATRGVSIFLDAVVGTVGWWDKLISFISDLGEGAQLLIGGVEFVKNGEYLNIKGNLDVLKEFGITQRRIKITNIKNFEGIAKLADTSTAINSSLTSKSNWVMAGVGVFVETAYEVSLYDETSDKIIMGTYTAVNGIVGAGISMAGAAYFGTAVGSAICPGVGTIAGFFAGFLIGGIYTALTNAFVKDPLVEWVERT